MNAAVFTICADSPDYNISGFQFALNAENFNISEVILGEDAELANMVNYAESDLFILALSYPMNYIVSGSNLELALFKGTYTLAEGLVQIVSTPGNNGSISIGSSNAEELSILINNVDWSEIPEN